jgi:hypothetical protein
MTAPDDLASTLSGIRDRGYRNGATGAECARLSDAAAMDVPLLHAAEAVVMGRVDHVEVEWGVRQA